MADAGIGATRRGAQDVAVQEVAISFHDDVSIDHGTWGGMNIDDVHGQTQGIVSVGYNPFESANGDYNVWWYFGLDPGVGVASQTSGTVALGARSTGDHAVEFYRAPDGELSVTFDGALVDTLSPPATDSLGEPDLWSLSTPTNNVPGGTSTFTAYSAATPEPATLSLLALGGLGLLARRRKKLEVRSYTAHGY